MHMSSNFLWMCKFIASFWLSSSTITIAFWLTKTSKGFFLSTIFHDFYYYYFGLHHLYTIYQFY